MSYKDEQNLLEELFDLERIFTQDKFTNYEGLQLLTVLDLYKDSPEVFDENCKKQLFKLLGLGIMRMSNLYSVGKYLI